MEYNKKLLGGKAIKANKGQLWKFTPNNDGSFICPEAQEVSRLYFPLMNRNGMKCSVTPEFKGDICTSFHKYHSIPIVTEDLHRVVNSRNFWVRVNGAVPWSVTGVSAWEKSGVQNIESEYKGEIGIFHVLKKNHDLNLSSSVSLFVPPVEDQVEIMVVKIKNIGEKAVNFVPFAANPLYGRSADNLRDHRNVTSMFTVNQREEHGVSIRPRINFNEFGHTHNDTNYFVLGYDQDGTPPTDIFRTVRDFAGEGGSYDKPLAVVESLNESDIDDKQIDGFEAMGGLKFNQVNLVPGAEASFIIINGIDDDRNKTAEWKEAFGTIDKALNSIEKTRKYWQGIVNEVSFKTGDEIFDNWTKWINYQLICRQVYGNSYLPDFGYGRGGRGWRDLFSDLLSIFLIDPENAKQEIINNFNGIRVDGTNATIVGTKPGEFVADRNNVPRTWSDHGTWPFFVLNFYMQQTGDFDVLLQEVTYWKDIFTYRSKRKDEKWDESYGFKQKTADGEIYKASILEHILLQHFCSFFNVGKNNNILLEGADWNDTYDMARQNGESVCFYNWYGSNMKTLAELLKFMNDSGLNEIELMDEMLMLLDTLEGQDKVDYKSPDARKKHLFKYYEKIQHDVSGKKTKIKTQQLINDLETKADEVFEHIRNNELITTKDGEKFYNGHYDDNANRVHGENPKGVRIDLTSQVLPTIFEVATDEMVPVLYSAVKKYLGDKLGGLRLCSDFKEERLYFGRLTGFIYGHKEHGGKWMQQNVMYMYGLYKRGFVKEGYEVYKDVYKLCNDSANAKIFPGIPSYFESDNHGAYHYLTGSATWLMLALVTQVFGVRGEYGNLKIEPKLTKEQFINNNEATISCNFQKKKLKVVFLNPEKLDWNEYKITEINVNGGIYSDTIADDKKSVVFTREKFIKALNQDENIIEITLG